MQDLPDEARVEEFVYLFFYSSVSLIVKLSQALIDRLGIGSNSQGMLGDFSRDSQHV
jgi:hypothetical protein